jgi:hypothetical protein
MIRQELRIGIFVVVASWIGCLMPPAPGLSQGAISNLKFSKTELDLLKDINNVAAAAGVSTTILKLSPFIALFSSPSPVDVAITVTTNDWDKIGGALSTIKQASACKIAEMIFSWSEIDDNKYSSKQTETFFKQIKSKSDSVCPH